MARTNKYTSINFNHILEKNHSPSSATATAAAAAGASTRPSSSSSYSSITSPNNSNINNTLYKSHGRMLVLTRPTPKPLPIGPPLSSSPQSHQTQTQIPDRTRSEPAPDQISLRPLGRTGTGPEHFSPVPGQDKDKEVGSIVIGSPKTGKFVPPHLRPGFTGKEEKPTPEVSRSRDSGLKYFGSPGRYGDDGRPKSGGYDKTRRVGESDSGLMNRPRSSGNRPSSSGSGSWIRNNSSERACWDEIHEKGIVIAAKAVKAFDNINAYDVELLPENEDEPSQDKDGIFTVSSCYR